ncbi:DUF6765 family protein [Paludibacterium purpuratum]|uniref:Uncharacterized protein n=1 Tax=Paludibacterium purpuratum TaxID=1144873 RepID=A0A4R7AZ33_9NEIS|nr:DUF6765 family protein [Paludibacterium purpuratum]TDR73350.1 hypothetical protein DFP86_114112 [Paludibacterium purpuratum]
MQIDMHYYGTYAMAASAGIPCKEAQIIAHAAQYVDDQDHEQFKAVRVVGGDTCEAVYGIATAHSPMDLNADAGLIHTLIKRIQRKPISDTKDDSRMVWVPFHFLPGGGNASYLERIICKTDSRIANEMISHHISLAGETFGLQLMGIAAHVYADTFSHFGFAGAESELNKVDINSINLDNRHSAQAIEKIWNLTEHIKTRIAGESTLGHGAVDTLPDTPFLKWEFTNASGEVDSRDNHALFLSACRRLHEHFTEFARAKGYGSASVKFDEIEPAVSTILRFEGDAEERTVRWMEAMGKGELGNHVQPCGHYDPMMWSDHLKAALDSRNATAIVNSDAYLFYAAADYHRHFVLKRLLPQHQVIVA